MVWLFLFPPGGVGLDPLRALRGGCRSAPLATGSPSELVAGGSPGASTLMLYCSGSMLWRLWNRCGGHVEVVEITWRLWRLIFFYWISWISPAALVAAVDFRGCGGCTVYYCGCAVHYCATRCYLCIKSSNMLRCTFVVPVWSGMQMPLPESMHAVIFS